VFAFRYERFLRGKVFDSARPTVYNQLSALFTSRRAAAVGQVPREKSPVDRPSALLNCAIVRRRGTVKHDPRHRAARSSPPREKQYPTPRFRPCPAREHRAVIGQPDERIRARGVISPDRA
jgi:hypothetical protein